MQDKVIVKKVNNKQGSFKDELLGQYIVKAVGILIVLLTVAIALFLILQGMDTFFVYNHSIIEFIFSSDWKPSDSMSGGGTVGGAIFIVGSLLTCGLALLIATPFAIASAIFITEISPKLGKKFVQPTMEIFVGIPSIIYGWVGYQILCGAIKNTFSEYTKTGMSVLAACIVLAIMIFPTITTVTADAIRSVPESYRKAGYGCGSTRWQVICKIVIPSAMPGILTAVILGLARAFGEALAVAYVLGRVLAFPTNIFDPTYNMTAIISSTMGETMNGSEKNAALWTMALLLFLISMAFIVLIHFIGRKRSEKDE